MLQSSSGKLEKDENRRFKTLWSVLLESWPGWVLLLTLLLAFGVFQIQIVKIVIPQEDFWFLLLGLLLLWAIMIIFRLNARNFAARKELGKAHQEIAMLEKQAAPSFLLEGIVLSSLTAHVELRKRERKYNPVKLDVFRLDCKITGNGERKDACVSYYLKGTNISGQTLRGIYLSIAADNLVLFKDLHAKLYNLHSNVGRNSPLTPRLDGPDGVRKDLFLPFLSPGVESFGSFEIELQYVWPGVFTPAKDYWFLDNLDYEGVTKQMIIGLEFVDVTANSVRGYSIDSISKIPSFEGELPPDPNDARRFVFEKANPDRDTYYIVLFEAS